VAPDPLGSGTHEFEPGQGQVALRPSVSVKAPAEQVRNLYRLSDPALSELGLEALLDELLSRVREALSVDTAAILLLDRESQELVARAAKGIEEEVERGVRIPLGQGFAGRIAAERVAIFVADVDRADILNPILREKGIRSLLGIPLIVEGDLIGVLHVGSLSPRIFDHRDLAVLQVAAARVAPGIERARLFSALEQEHRVAVVLQRSLLPKRPVEMVGVSVASRYLPARDEVGGDWYDVIELPSGMLGVAIGDVVGHGVRAAALMGQLRTALHAYAIQGYNPGRVLELVDRFAHAMSDDAMATAAYAVLDPETGKVQLASAAHLPPIVVGEGRAWVEEVTPAPPLGAFPYGTCPEHEFTLATGQILFFYTDGLVERPGTALNLSMNELALALVNSTSAEGACRLAVEELVPFEGLRDDVAIIAVQNGQIPTELFLQLPAVPGVLADMRRGLRRWLRTHGATESDLTEVTLAVSEACSNAIEHAYSPAPAMFELVGTAQGDVVTFVITDGGRWRAPRGHDRGRGLTIIDAAMDEVDVKSDETGTSVRMQRRLGVR
jgi:anti-sigma regulatory factor (Ser/Thr protein kinase)/putative methionine-R-sulfoxide reductase with GAF domain